MKSIITTVSIILLLIVLPALLTLGVRYLPDRYQPSLDKVFDLYGPTSLSQSFIATDDNLAIIGLSIKNPNLQNKKDLTLTVVDSGNNILSTSTLNGASIPDGDFVKFKFSPIISSKSKHLTFVLSSPSSNRNDALEIFLTKQKLTGVDDLKKLPLSVDASDVASTSASFVPFYKVNSPLSLIKNTVSDFSSRFFADRIFAVCYILLVALLLITLLAKFPLNRLRK